MMYTLLFLDLDGVLNSINFYRRRGGMVPHRSVFERHADELDPIAVDLLKDFVLQYSIDIVISSTWRRLFSIIEMKDLFALTGWENIPIIDVTPYIPGIRGNEINQWLEAFDGEWENYIILDDDKDFTTEQLENNFIHVSGRTGLVQEHIDEMKRRLGKT